MVVINSHLLLLLLLLLYWFMKLTIPLLCIYYDCVCINMICQDFIENFKYIMKFKFNSKYILEK